MAGCGGYSLPMEHALEVRHDGTLIFWSDGKWLHPLFDLAAFLAASPLASGELRLRDKIVGRAAALLAVHLGIGHVHADVLSRHGQAVLMQFGVAHTYDTLVDRIACRTEDLLLNDTDPADAFTMLAERARRVAAAP